MPLAPPPFTWTGCYAGAQAGGGFGQKDLNDSAGIVSSISGFTSANLNISGYMLGGQIGCDYQFASQLGSRRRRRRIRRKYRRQHRRRHTRPSRRQRNFQGNDGFTDQRHRTRRLRMEQLVALRAKAAPPGRATATAHSTRLRPTISRDWRPGLAGPRAQALNGRSRIFGRSSWNMIITASARAV